MSLRQKSSFDVMDSGNVVDFPTVENPDSDASPSGLGSMVSKEEYNVLQLFTGSWFQMNKALFIKLFCQSGLTANELAVTSAVVMLTYGRKKPEKASRISIDDIYIIADLTHVRIRQIVGSLIKRNILFRDGELLGLNKFYSLWVDKNGNGLFQKTDKNDVHKSEHETNVHKSEHETNVHKSEHQCSDLRTSMFTKVNILEDDTLYTKDIKTKDSRDGAEAPSSDKDEKPKKRKSRKNDSLILMDLKDLPDFIDPELWELWRNVRKEIKKPLTVSQEKGQIAALIKGDQNGYDANAVIQASISGGWQGLFFNKEQLKTNISNRSASGRINRQAELEQQNANAAMSWAERKHADAIKAAAKSNNGDQDQDDRN